MTMMPHGVGKRPAPGLSFFKNKKGKKADNLVKDFIFSSVDHDGEIAQLFPISINLSEVFENFGQLSVTVICSAIEQELRDQGEVARLIVLDARGQPVMDFSQTRRKEFWTSQRTFRVMSQNAFRKWKPGVWAAVTTRISTLDDEDEDEYQPPPNQTFYGREEHGHQLAPLTSIQNEDKFSEIKAMFQEIKNSIETKKKAKKLEKVFKCVICQSTCAASMYFCVTACGQLIGCFYCTSKIEECPLCRAVLPAAQIRRPMSVGGLADIVGIPEISLQSALSQAKIVPQSENDHENDDDIL